MRKMSRMKANLLWPLEFRIFHFFLQSFDIHLVHSMVRDTLQGPLLKDSNENEK